MNESDMAMTDVAMSAHTTGPRFGIMTAPSQVSYRDVLRVWREADTIPEIEHAWLFDHLMPIGGDPNGTDRLSVSLRTLSHRRDLLAAS
jgi:hypothetical protein